MEILEDLLQLCHLGTRSYRLRYGRDSTVEPTHRRLRRKARAIVSRTFFVSQAKAKILSLLIVLQCNVYWPGCLEPPYNPQNYNLRGSHHLKDRQAYHTANIQRWAVFNGQSRDRTNRLFQPVPASESNRNKLSPRPTTGVSFLDLPRELRDIIYSICVTSETRARHQAIGGFNLYPTSNDAVPWRWQSESRVQCECFPRSYWYSGLCPFRRDAVNVMLSNKRIYNEIMYIHCSKLLFTFNEPEELMGFARFYPFATSHIYSLSLAITGSPVEWAIAIKHANFKNLRRLRIWSFQVENRRLHPELWQALLEVLSNNMCLLQIVSFDLTDDQQDDVPGFCNIIERFYELPKRSEDSNVSASSLANPVAHEYFS